MQNPDSGTWATMQGMADWDVRFSLDDFGLDFSSFMHLQRCLSPAKNTTASFVKVSMWQGSDRPVGQCHD